MRKPALLVAALVLTAAALSGQSSKFNKTIPFPRPGPTDLNFTLEKCTVREVEIKGYPSREDIEDARKKDPDDHSLVLWRFHVDNRGTHECRVRVWVEILDKNDHVVQAGDHSANVDAGKVDDDITLTMRMRTLDVADSPKVRVRAEIIPK